MRLPILSLLGAALGFAQALAQTEHSVTSATLDESEVRITYGELKRLVAATLPKAPLPEVKAQPPVPAALTGAVYHLDAAAGTIVAEIQVENFDGGWHAVPIAGAAAGALSVEPAAAAVVIKGDNLCFITDKAGSHNVKLTFRLEDEGQGTLLKSAASAVSALDVKALPEGKVLRIQHGAAVQIIGSAGIWALPSAGGEISLLLEGSEASQASLLGAATDDAIISTAAYTTLVVRDGAVLTEGTIVVRHDHPVKVAMHLPEGAKLLQCHVNSEPVRPADGEANRIEIPLDEPTTDGAESEIRLSFTSVVAELQSAEGELDLLLPRTPVFAKQIEWNVQLPLPYDLTISGNVDPVTEKPPGAGIHLRKSLCRDQQPQARVIYRKRSSN